MQRRGQPAALAARRNPPARLDEVKLAIKPDPVPHAQPPVKIQQVDAAAQQNVLAVVDHFTFAARRAAVGSSASAQKAAGFEQFHFKSGAAQRRRRRESGQTAADHDGCGHPIGLQGACGEGLSLNAGGMAPVSAAIDNQHNGDGQHHHDKDNVG